MVIVMKVKMIDFELLGRVRWLQIRPWMAVGLRLFAERQRKLVVGMLSFFLVSEIGHLFSGYAAYALSLTGFIAAVLSFIGLGAGWIWKRRLAEPDRDEYLEAVFNAYMWSLRDAEAKLPPALRTYGVPTYEIKWRLKYIRLPEPKPRIVKKVNFRTMHLLRESEI